jgi:hypothetical protein
MSKKFFLWTNSNLPLKVASNPSCVRGRIVRWVGHVVHEGPLLAEGGSPWQ